MKKKLLLISPFLILVIIIAVGLQSLYVHNQQQSIDSKISTGQEVFLPKFSLPNLYPNQPNLSNQDFTQKYSLINVFASWCVNCAQEHKILMRLSQNPNINIYGIAWRDIDENTKNYLDKNGNPYSKIAVDNKGLMSKLLSVSGTPESFLIDDRGRVLYHQVGALNDEILKIIGNF